MNIELDTTPLEMNKLKGVFMFTCLCGMKKPEWIRIKMHKGKCIIHKEHIQKTLTKEVLSSLVDNLTINDIIVKFNYEFSKQDILLSLNNCGLLNKYVCICGKKFYTLLGLGVHKIQVCVEFGNYLSKKLTKEFFDEYVGIKKMPFTVIVEDILKNEFSLHMFTQQAAKFGYYPLSSSDAIKNEYTQAKIINTTLEHFGVVNCSQNDIIKKQKVLTMVDHFGEIHHLKLKSQQEKQKHTVQERYDRDNVSQVEEVKLTKEETFLEHYGIRNIFCNYDYIKEFYIKYWNVDNPSKVLEFELKKEETLYKNYGVRNCGALSSRTVYSKVSQKMFWELYNNLSLTLKNLVYFHELNREYKVFFSNGKYALLDFSIISNDMKIAIEFHGDYWHMNPITYESTDINEYTTITASKTWEKDYNRIKLIEDQNFKVLVIWEYEYSKNKKIILDRCFNFINENCYQTLVGV